MTRLAALAVTLLIGSLIPGPAATAETPRKGGVLLAVIGADAPSLDCHQESTFACLQMVAPLYSLLLQIDPYHYPKVIGDLATEWKISPDGLTVRVRDTEVGVHRSSFEIGMRRRPRRLHRG